MIVVFGSINMDLFFKPARAPAAGETVLLPGYTTLPGGKGANQAVAASRMGATVRMAGCAGTDGFGRELLEVLHEHGVDTALIAKGRAKTGTAVIILEDNGENRILVASGANAEAQSSAVPDAMLAPGATLLMQMEMPPGEVAALAARAKERGARVILNLAPAISPGEDALRALDYLIVNEVEIAQLSESLGRPANGAIRDMAGAIARDYGFTCVVTLGGQGALAARPDGAFVTGTALSLPRVVDTTGAGDGFCGAFAAALDQGKTLEEALSLACATGSLACLKMGAIASYPLLDDVLSALRVPAAARS